MIEPDPELDCIDCGGRAVLVSYPPELGWFEGDVAVYRCKDCLDRWDVVVGDPGDE